jgi:hypothetical protein
MTTDPTMPSRRQFLQQLAATATLAALPLPALAGAGGAVNIKMRTAEAMRLLNPALTKPNFWSGASVSRYDDQLYDEIRIKSLEAGYLTMITGEGDQDFTPDGVVKTVFDHQDKLPRHMDGAKALPRLRLGTDSFAGVPSNDRYFLADFGIFYGEFFQRSYKFELADGRKVVAFEKIKKDWVSAATWEKYQARRKATLDRVDMRSMFGSVVEITDSWGMFVVSPGTKHSSRVTLVAKIRFGEGTGMMAQLGSKMPPVLKAGLKSGFDASVAVAKGVTSGKYK